MKSIVYNSDCLIALREMPDKAFDLAIVDPPYGIGENGGRNKTADRPVDKWRNPSSPQYKAFDDSLPPTKEYFESLLRVSKNQIIWGGNYFSHLLPPSMCWICWDKKIPETQNGLSDMELAFTSFKRRARIFRYLWAGFAKAEPITRVHPTQKPVALYRWLLTNYAKPGDTILDTHLGSGSSRIAAYDLGFDFTGYELDKDYFEAQEARFANHIAQARLFDAPVLETVEQNPLF